MKILIHENSEVLKKAISSDFEEVELSSRTCTSALWELAEKYPEEVICWCEQALVEHFKNEEIKNLFPHDLMMFSYSVNSHFLPRSIGYIDQFPFVSENRNVRFPTWRMSGDMGAIMGKVLLQFRKRFGAISGFEYLLNSIAKTGQQNSLFCYSDPSLTSIQTGFKPTPRATSRELFSFVYAHYNRYWSIVLLWCLWRYEKKLHIWSYLLSLFSERNHKTKVDLSAFTPTPKDHEYPSSIDVLIPTFGRQKYLEQVLEDLKWQTLLPKNVIVIEQNPNPSSKSGLSKMLLKNWPFKIVHHFTHQTGACNARNIGLDKVRSEWVFFADDDIRLSPGLLKSAMVEIEKYQLSAINLNCKQKGEKTVFDKVKQWASFGAGTSIVKGSFAKRCRFSVAFEYGFGEDADYGMQLRNKGCDIIYHPHLQTLHLKAPYGGFRKKAVLPWEGEDVQPKPSPTLMSYVLKHYSPEQIKGYRISLFLRFYSRQLEKNPFRYLKKMRKKWQISLKWSRKILEASETTRVSV